MASLEVEPDSLVVQLVFCSFCCDIPGWGQLCLSLHPWEDNWGQQGLCEGPLSQEVEEELDVSRGGGMVSVGSWVG